MAFRDLIYLVLTNLKRMKTRVAMTASGVLVGTAAVILLISLGEGLQQNFKASIGRLGDLSLLPVSVPYDDEQSMEMGSNRGSQPERGPKPVLNRDMVEEIRQIPDVAGATPYQMVGLVNVGNFRGLEMHTNQVGVDPDTFDKLGLELEIGEAILGPGKVIIGGQVGSYSFDPRKKETIQLASRDFYNQTIEVVYTRYLGDLSDPNVQVEEKTVRLQVVGVLKSIGGVVDHAVFTNLAEVETLIAWANGSRIDRDRLGYSDVLVKASNSRTGMKVEETLTEMGFKVSSPRSFIKEMNQFFLMIQAVLAAIGGIALLVSAFGIANTMVMAIYERTREIGLLKSVGATNADILLIFLAEAGGIGLLGGSGGLLVSFFLCRLVNRFGGEFISQQGAAFFSGQFGPTQLGTEMLMIPAWLPAFALVFAVLIGTLSGVFPAIRAASLDPLEALRYE
jgi:putative ABC transport system permease protein